MFPAVMGAINVIFSAEADVLGCSFSAVLVLAVVRLVEVELRYVDEVLAVLLPGLFFFAAPTAMIVTQTATTTRRERAMESARFICNFF